MFNLPELQYNSNKIVAFFQFTDLLLLTLLSNNYFSISKKVEFEFHIGFTWISLLKVISFSKHLYT
jgi:hypothetical protein